MAASRDGAVARARSRIEDGSFLEDLRRRVAIPTESQVEGRQPDLYRYCTDEIGPSFTRMGWQVQVFDNPVKERGPFLVATRIEGKGLPTMLGYGHGDVVRAIKSEWREGLDPWEMKIEGEKIYGRGVVDNKGQHTLAMHALDAVAQERSGRLGFNAKFIVETGEEQGSPGLEAFITAHKALLAADFFLGLDGPRQSFSRPELNLGCRGGVMFDLVCDLRKIALHSGHWGGVMKDAGLRLAQALARIVTEDGRIQVPELLPKTVPESVLRAARELLIDPVPGMPEPDKDWGEPGLSKPEKVLAWTSFIVLAYSCGNPDNPVNAVPGYAKARCQIRHTVDTSRDDFLPAIRRFLDAHGFQDIAIGTRVGRDQFTPSRTDPDHPWVQWVAQSMSRTMGAPTNISPNSSGSNPSEMFRAHLDLPVMWAGQSYAGCSQHGPNEHGLRTLFWEGLGYMAGVYWDLAEGGTPKPRGVT